MSTPVLDLCQAVVTAVATATGKTVTRRYVPYSDATAITDGVWFGVPASEDTTKARVTDKSKLEIDLAYQRALPDATTANPNPLENSDFLDDCMDEVESVKSLFREGGSLADGEFSSNWVLLGMTNKPIYRPDLLLEHQIFTSVIRLEFLAQE